MTGTIDDLKSAVLQLLRAGKDEDVATERVLAAVERTFDAFVPAPIPMRIPCEGCGELHIDEDEFAAKPHHTHACQHCGMTWRNAVVHTVGVRFLPGFRNAAPTSNALDNRLCQQCNEPATCIVGAFAYCNGCAPQDAKKRSEVPAAQLWVLDDGEQDRIAYTTEEYARRDIAEQGLAGTLVRYVLAEQHETELDALRGRLQSIHERDTAAERRELAELRSSSLAFADTIRARLDLDGLSTTEEIIRALDETIDERKAVRAALAAEEHEATVDAANRVTGLLARADLAIAGYRNQEGADARRIGDLETIAKKFESECAHLKQQVEALRESNKLAIDALAEVDIVLESVGFRDMGQELPRGKFIASLDEERALLRTQRLTLAQGIEDLLLVAKTDEDADGYITDYHFKTGALHRLLGLARDCEPRTNRVVQRVRPPCGLRAPFDGFSPCVAPYGHDGGCDHRPKADTKAQAALQEAVRIARDLVAWAKVSGVSAASIISAETQLKSLAEVAP